MGDALIVDDDRDLCDILREYFTMLGVAPCLIAHSMEEVQALPTLPRDLAVLDINLGPNAPSGIDVHHWLDAHGFAGRLVYLTGHARSSPLVRSVLELPNVTLLSKPVSMDELKRLVR